MRTIFFPVVAGAALLAGCEMRVGNDAADVSTGNVSAAGKAEDGQLSVSAPGFEMKLDIPEGIRSRAGIDDDNGLIYPAAQFSGIHVQGGGSGAQSGSDGEVELRFTSADAPDAVLRWYRDPARAPDFTVAGAGRDGQDFVVTGTTRDDNGQFRVRLSPRAGGGTDGRMVLADRTR